MNAREHERPGHRNPSAFEPKSQPRKRSHNNQDYTGCQLLLHLPASTSRSWFNYRAMARMRPPYRFGFDLPWTTASLTAEPSYLQRVYPAGRRMHNAFMVRHGVYILPDGMQLDFPRRMWGWHPVFMAEERDASVLDTCVRLLFSYWRHSRNPDAGEILATLEMYRTFPLRCKR